MNNSHIQGRKIDSPKIYVKELGERPKTSAQQVRKNSHGPPKKVKKERQQDTKKIPTGTLLLATQTNKESNAKKFDFKFAQTTKADSKREKPRKSAGKQPKKPNLNKSQIINLRMEKASHHRT
jgi:hypothetical protein